MRHATLVFAVAGGRTDLLRALTPYPFHVTRPFYLDRALPDLATLYLQSTSGGLYGDDDLLLDIAVGPGARAMVTTQAATIARHGRGGTARMATRIEVAPGGMLVHAPDPLVMFPGARVATRTEITLHAGATLLCIDGFACHDPGGGRAAFDRLDARTVVRRPDGRVLLAEAGMIEGDELNGPASPLGPYAAFGSVLLFGTDTTPADWQAAADAAGCLAGLSALPNEAGCALRVLAPDGGRLARGLAGARDAGFAALFGHAPAPRRK